MFISIYSSIHHEKVRHYFHHNGPIQVKPIPYTIPSCNGYIVEKDENIQTFKVNYIKSTSSKEDTNFSHQDKSHYDYSQCDFDGKAIEKQRDNEQTFSPSKTCNNENNTYREYLILEGDKKCGFYDSFKYSI